LLSAIDVRLTHFGHIIPIFNIPEPQQNLNSWYLHFRF
jgi:hypothetical protein